MQTHAFGSAHHKIIVVGCMLCMTSACAAFVPQVITPQLTQDTTPKLEVKASSGATLRFVEGRPNGVLMTTRWPILPKDATHLHVERQHGKEKPTVIQVIKLASRYKAALGGKGLSILDGGLSKAGDYSYRILAISKQPLGQSQTMEITWRTPAPMPIPIKTRAVLDPTHIELSWPHKTGWGAVVFRRDLFGTQRRLRRIKNITAAHHATIFDRNVQPGGIYAYRVAYARIDARGQRYFGQPSPEVFVTVPQNKPSTTQPNIAPKANSESTQPQ